MKKLLFLIAVFCGPVAIAQNYLISFTGTGASTSVSSVKVENLTKNTSLTLNGSDILHLTVATGINSIEDNQSSKLKFYPNPMNDYSMMEIYPPIAGNAIITVCDITGKQVTQIQSYLENSRQDFRLSGIKNGFYLVNVKGNSYQFTGKLLSNSKSGGTISIVKVNSTVQIADKKIEKSESKGTQGTVDMEYSNGDRLKLTGISGIYTTIMTDILTGDKTITFNFETTADSDNNHYSIVDIGSQVWFAENLMTTKFNDGTLIPLVENNTDWGNLTTPGYSWYNNSRETYIDPFGALYNGYAVSSGKLCPIGWHVPTVDEWNSLKDYLSENDFGYLGDQLAIAKSLASITEWKVPSLIPNHGGYLPIPTGAVGKDPQYNNTTGFNGFPAGIRSSDGSFSDLGSLSAWWSATGTSSLWDFSMQNGEYGQEVGLQQGSDYKTPAFSVRCIKGQINILPTLITTHVSNITQTTAASGGTIAAEGESLSTIHGVCWSTSVNPTIENSKTEDGTGIGAFTSSITGLTPGTIYYMRAYSINNEGTAYGNLEMFSTDIADIDGNIYNTIIIDDMIWMVENLRTTRNNDGTAIPLVADNTAWALLTASGYCWYNNDASKYKSTYGGLYNWYGVNTGKLCPINWYVSTDDDWAVITILMGGENMAGAKFKESGTVHWLAPNTGATNEVGLTALPGGDRSSTGVFSSIGVDGTWWTSTEYNSTNAWYQSMNYNVTNLTRNYYFKNNGFSVRCVKK